MKSLSYDVIIQDFVCDKDFQSKCAFSREPIKDKDKRASVVLCAFVI